MQRAVRRPGILTGIMGALLLASGCSLGHDDRPTTARAGHRLDAWMDDTHGELQRGVAPLTGWRPSDDATKDETPGCDKGEARRTYAATLDVPATSRPDVGLRSELLIGQLIQAGWDPKTGPQAAARGTVTATRKKDDSTGSVLRLVFTPVQGGWHYQVSGRTDCLPTSD